MAFNAVIKIFFLFAFTTQRVSESVILGPAQKAEIIWFNVAKNENRTRLYFGMAKSYCDQHWNTPLITFLLLRSKRY